MAMGEAAGVASSQVVERDIRFQDVNTDQLRSRLQEYGVLLAMT
jgi:hypothetical protein